MISRIWKRRNYTINFGRQFVHRRQQLFGSLVTVEDILARMEHDVVSIRKHKFSSVQERDGPRTK